MSTRKPPINRYIVAYRAIKISLSLLFVGTCVLIAIANKLLEMARYNDKTEVSKQHLEDFAKALREIAGMIDGNVDRMVQNQMETVNATHGRTREEAADGLVKFCGAVQSAIAEALIRTAMGLPSEQVAKELKVAELADRYNNRKKPKDKDK